MILALKILVGIISVVFSIVVPVYVVVRMKRVARDLPTMSTDALRKMLEKKQNVFLHGNRVLAELTRRNEDIRFVLPHILTMTLDGKIADRMLGWMLLTNYYCDEFPELDFNKDRPGDSDRLVLQSKLAQVESVARET